MSTKASEKQEEKSKLPPMEYRLLGNSGLKVSVLSLGSWVTFGSQVKENDIIYDCMKRAFDAGVNFFDCAEAYASGEGERMVGEVIKRAGWKRSDLVISTKIFWGGGGPNDKGLSRKHVCEGLAASLKRLQLDYVDLLYCHRPDALTPMEEIVRTMNHVINQGKVFYWGTSEWTASQIFEAVAVAKELKMIGPLMEQPQYNMFTRDRIEKEYAHLYKTTKLGLTTWSPLASGVLSGKYNDGIPKGTRFDEPKMDYSWMQRLRGSDAPALIDKLHKLNLIAKALGCTLAQLAIAWCVKNPNVSSVITGASKPEQVDENLKALAVVTLLTPEVIEQIENILSNKPAPQDTYGRDK